MKTCKKCLQSKPLSAFAQYRPEHYHDWCKACVEKTATCYPPKNDGQLRVIFDKKGQNNDSKSHK